MKEVKKKSNVATQHKPGDITILYKKTYSDGKFYGSFPNMES